MKFCSLCNIEKPLTEFPLRKGSKDGYRCECKQCKSERDSARHAERMSDPAEKEREVARLRLFREAMSPDEKERIHQHQLARAKRLVREKQANFFEKHGCARQELKYKQDKKLFIDDGLERNGPKYSYHAVVYKGVHGKVDIWCNVHHKFFSQTVHDHKIGRGCPECGKIATGEALRKSQVDFLKDAEDFCGDKFTFELVKYVDNKTPVEVTCKIHGPFPIRPGNLLTGKGCPACAKYGYRNILPGSLYVLFNGELTKIGITNGPVEVRLKQINKKGKGFSVVCQHLFDSGKHASDFETTLLKELREQYLQPTEKFDGSTECFFGLDPNELASDILARLPQHIEETNDYRPIEQSWQGTVANC